MGAMTAIMLAMGVQQVMSGYQAKGEASYNASLALSESKYNASIMQQQAGMIQNQKDLQLAQGKRAVKFVMGQTVQTAAAKGIEMSGSPMAIMIDTQTQMEMDIAIGQYNLEVQKFGVLSQAESIIRKGKTVASQYRRSGDNAVRGGWMSGITTMYSAGVYSKTSSFDVGKMAKAGTTV